MNGIVKDLVFFKIFQKFSIFFIKSKKKQKKSKELISLLFYSIIVNLIYAAYYAVASTLGAALDTITIAGRIKRPFNS